MQSHSSRVNVFDNIHLGSISSPLSELLISNYSNDDSEEIASPSSTDSISNQLVLITTNFCSNFPLLKPIEENQLKERSLVEMGFDANIVPNWQSISQPQKPDMQTLLLERIRRHDNADVEIHIESTIFRCHLIVLQCYSKYFADINDPPKIVDLPSDHVTPQAFYMVYKWMLNSNPTIGRKGIVEFFKAAQFLKIESASSQCWACICDSQVVEDAAFLLYLEARDAGLLEIQKSMAERICKFFLILVASKEFLKLNVDEVVMFLSSNSIGIHSEMEVFMSALRWLCHDWKTRSNYSIKLMECVRFAHLSQSQLLLLKRSKEDEVRKVVDDTVTKLIDDAIGLHIIRMDRNTVAFRDESTFIEPVERQWLLDERILGCLNYSNNASFIMFLDYLRYIRDVEPFCWKKFREANSNPSIRFQTDSVANGFGTSPEPEVPNADINFEEEHGNPNQIEELTFVRTINRAAAKEPQEDEPCKDTKVLFRSENYHASDSTVTSSKFRPSKVLRYNHTINKAPAENPCLSRGSTATCNKKKLSFSEFESNLEEYSSYRSTSQTLTNSSSNTFLCDSILIFGGKNPTSGMNSESRQVFQYDPSKNKWNMVSLMPNGRQYHSAVIYQERIYIAGGIVTIQSKQVTTNSMVSFDPATQCWFKEPNIPVKIKNFSFIVSHLQIYAIGGEDSSGKPLNMVFRYDPVNATWNTEKPMHFKRSRAAATMHRNFIWVAGGLSIESITDSVEYFDPITGIWTETCFSLRVPRCFARMCSINGKLFIVGGMGEDGHSMGSIDIFDNVSGKWSKIDDMDKPRHGHEVFVINSFMIIVGGSNSRTGEFVSEVECYSHSKLAWIDEFEPLPVPVVGMVGVVLPHFN